MLLSRNWLGDFVELPEDPEELAARLTAAGMAVDGYEARGDDVVYEIDVTTNRPDAMNHLGLAREVAVLFGHPLAIPAVESAVTNKESTAAVSATDMARLVVEDFEDCPRYDALMIRNVTVGPSPDWLVQRLEAIGSRSINNIVDITNYVLWETGQPLHAFDLEKIDPLAAGLPEVRVRRAREGETLVTLDGASRELTPEILVIANSQHAIALGGIMGGLDSEVTNTTRHVLLESAHFTPKVVRRGAKLLGMHTDASHRFERGADPEACLWAARRAAALMVDVAGGEVVSGHLEERSLRQDWPPVLQLDHGKLLRFGGVEITADEVERTLTGLGFELEWLAEEEPHWRVRVPSWRYYDFEDAYPADLYEEVLRIHGFDEIQATLPQIGGVDAPERPEHILARKLRDHLAASGFAEVINFGFHDRASDAAYPSLYQDQRPLALANPLSDRYAVMRRSLLPNLVTSARYNQRRGATAVRMFEIGHIFAESHHPDQHQQVVAGCLEQETLAIVLGGHLGTPWEGGEIPLDFFDLKGVVETLVEGAGLAVETRPAQRPLLVEGATAELFLPGRDEPFGYLGELAQDEGHSYRLFVAELATGALVRDEVDLGTRAPSRHPAVGVDMTLTHAKDVPWVELARAIEEQGVPDLVQFGLKDRYLGKGVPPGAVNTTLFFLYNAEDRSLTQDEVNERHSRLAEELNRRFGFQTES